VYVIRANGEKQEMLLIEDQNEIALSGAETTFFRVPVFVTGELLLILILCVF
jgi:hypothetical protein